MPSLLSDFLVTLTLVPARSSTSPSVGEAEYALMSLSCLPVIMNSMCLSVNPLPVDALENAAQVWVLLLTNSYGNPYNLPSSWSIPCAADLPDQSLADLVDSTLPVSGGVIRSVEEGK